MLIADENVSWLSYSKGVLALIALVSGLYLFELLKPVDRLIYDAYVRLNDRAVSEDIIIIEIDKVSLDNIGHWPWPRSVMAELINKLSSHSPKVILLDVLYSEPSIPQEDVKLYQAIKNAGNVILPVVGEYDGKYQQFTQNLPIKSLREAAFGIGHVDHEPDLDSVSRRSYLYAGLSGTVPWPAIAVKAIETAGDEVLSGKIESSANSTRRNLHFAMSWERFQEFLLPYAGGVGSFKRISVNDVLSGEVEKQQFANKYILIGATAIGMGDALPTPVSGEGEPMPGIEIIANEIDSLRQGLMISEIKFMVGYSITLIIVILSFICWFYLIPRHTLFYCAAIILAALILNYVILANFKLWLPPATLILGLLLGYLGWLWGRLIYTVKYLNNELIRLGDVNLPSDTLSKGNASDSLNFLMNLDGFYSSYIKDDKGKVLFQWDKSIDLPNETEKNESKKWSKSPIKRENKLWEFGLYVDEQKVSEVDTIRIIEQISNLYSSNTADDSFAPVEFINNRINLVKDAHSRLLFLNNFITELLEQINNTLMVTDTFGGVVLANHHAEQMFNCDSNEIYKKDINYYLEELIFFEQRDWHQIFSEAMFDSKRFACEAKTKRGEHLLINLDRYTSDGVSVSGMVLNIIDVSILKETERSRNELLSFLSHDLRSPLASLIATTDLAKIKPDYQQSDNFLNSIKNNSIRALQMADDFLAIMRAENIQQDTFVPVDLKQIIQMSINVVEGSADAKKIKLKTNIKIDESIDVLGDAPILERVLINLLVNSIKYSPESSEIEIGLDAIDKEAHCWIKDQGYGIKQEDQEKIFMRFETIRHEGSQESLGAGLGLSFVQSSIKRHHGRIELQSNPGEGSCFTVYLPLYKADKDKTGENAVLANVDNQI